MRIDSHVYSGYDVSPYYDSMVGKIIVSGDTRDVALSRLDRALKEFMIEGPSTSVPLGRALLMDERVRQGKYNTQYLELFLKNGGLSNLG